MTYQSSRIPSSIKACSIRFHYAGFIAVRFKRVLVSLAFILGLASIFSSRTVGQNAQNLTVQLPVLGVSVDVDGVLETQLFKDETNQLMKKRLSEGGFNRLGQLRKTSALRKVSLRRLELAVKRSLESKEILNDELTSLAGLTSIKYVFVFPEQKDIVIAGPAEPWVKNLGGRSVGIVSGKPTLMLDDIVVALRAFAPVEKGRARVPVRRKWIACSIDPTPAGVAGLQEFQKTIPRQVPQSRRAEAANYLAKGMQQSLGNADIRVYGISPKTHLAQVMIEADYRMKMIGLGLEQPPIQKLQTFLGALKGAPRDMQRWWFEPDYKRIKLDPDELAIEFIGSTIKLTTENISLDQAGRPVKSKSKSSFASRTYASSFTKNFSRIETASPVYRQLRQAVDLLVAFAWMKKSGAYAKANWAPSSLLDEQKLSVENLPKPKKCPCVANAVWKGNRLILPAGGGVSISPDVALVEENLTIVKSGIAKATRVEINIDQSVGSKGNGSWWWD